MAFASVASSPAFAVGNNGQTQPKAAQPTPANAAEQANNKKQSDHKDKPQQLGNVAANSRKMARIDKLCLLRKALTAGYSRDPAKADDIVCRARQITGSHFYGISCTTNKQYYRAKLDNGGTPPVVRSGGISGRNVHQVSKDTIRKLTTDPRIKAFCVARAAKK